MLAAKQTERLWQICSCLLSPTAPSFPSCRKRRGRKGALGRVWRVLLLNSGKTQCFRRRSTRCSPYGRLGTRRLIRGVPNLQLVAVEYLLSIEGADQVCWSAPFCIGFYCFARTKGSPFRGRFPLSGGNVPKGQKGVGMLSPKVTERLSQICCDLSVSASPSHLPWKGRPLCA